MPRSRAIRRPVVQVLLGIVAGLLVSECVARLVLPGKNWTPGVPISTSMLVPSEHSSFRMAPDLDGEWLQSWLPPARVLTDGVGQRIPGPDADRSDAGPRILVLGASYTWGYGEAADVSWPYRLEQMLREGGREARVTNGAQIGYAFPDMVGVLEGLAPEDRPDHVFMAIPAMGLYIIGVGPEVEHMDVGAVANNATFLPQVAGDSGAEMVGGWLLRSDRPWKNPVIDFLRTRTAIGHRMLHALWVANRPLKIQKSGEPNIDYAVLEKRAGEIGDRMRALVMKYREAGVPVTLFLLPNNLRVFKRPIGPKDMPWFIKLAERSGYSQKRFDLVDLAGVSDARRVKMDESAGGDFSRLHMHYSRSGHQKIARAIADWYLEEGWKK